MAIFEFPKSPYVTRPVWGKLEAKVGLGHLMIADAEGAEAIIDIATPELMAKTHIIFVAKGTDYGVKLRSLKSAQFYESPSYEAAVSCIRKVLSSAHTGIQIYLAGTESLMGQVMSEAMSVGFPHEAIQTEHRGSIGRRMQCVHCKGITEDVKIDPFACAHCGLTLFVRDHYSRRLAAYQGVRVDAEDHGNIPETKEIYE